MSIDENTAARVAKLARIKVEPDALPALALCAIVCWALRAGSLLFGWQLPVYKSRPPRN